MWCKESIRQMNKVKWLKNVEYHRIGFRSKVWNPTRHVVPVEWSICSLSKQRSFVLPSKCPIKTFKTVKIAWSSVLSISLPRKVRSKPHYDCFACSSSHNCWIFDAACGTVMLKFDLEAGKIFTAPAVCIASRSAQCWLFTALSWTYTFSRIYTVNMCVASSAFGCV